MNAGVLTPLLVLKARETYNESNEHGRRRNTIAQIAWYEQHHHAQRQAHSRKRIRVEHGIAHLKNWRALARHLTRRTNFDHTVRAVAGLLSDHQHIDRSRAAG
ncbi:hypothetical protein [Nocardia higoensis]|uniref:hypothetical protein n=1 Tax=Nocardia higoensis TaxID=228599 RepID=UPI001C3F37C2|nr:hypothetical protein [Nocardia higoensis]